MDTSKRIAGLLGPTLIVMAISEWINLRDILSTPIPPAFVYLTGILLFVAGLAIVREHNRWSGGWPVVVTIMGWFLLAGGLFRMCAPLFALQALRDGASVHVVLAVIFVVGVFLSLMAFRRAAGLWVPGG